jgi:hypothetical protein
MVLKNSKWDRKAKTKYLKKHGLNKKPVSIEPDQRPKWSSKRAGTSNQQIILEDSDSEWDSEEDEELLNQYYPEIGKENLTREQKEKIKQQILQGLIEEQENSKEEANEAERNREEQDGIYLGSEENRIKENIAEEKKTKLDEYVSKDTVLTKTKKNRKLPKNRMQDNLLEEYGIENYSDTVTKDIDDYNLSYYSQKERRNIDKIPASELDGFRIGESSLVNKSKAPYQDTHTLRNLTEEEIKENAERAVKSEQNKFYNQIKTRFNVSESGPNTKSKVIEINNFNENDADQLKNLNSKLINNNLGAPALVDNELDDDIDILLGDVKHKNEPKKVNSTPENLQHNDNIDSFLSSLSISKDKKLASKNESLHQNTYSTKNYRPNYQEPKTLPDQDFLDDLLS